MCELALELIKTRAHLHSWNIQSYPGKIRLPADIFRALPNAEAASKVWSGLASSAYIQLNHFLDSKDCIFTGGNGCVACQTLQTSKPQGMASLPAH